VKHPPDTIARDPNGPALRRKPGGARCTPERKIHIPVRFRRIKKATRGSGG